MRRRLLIVLSSSLIFLATVIYLIKSNSIIESQKETLDSEQYENEEEQDGIKNIQQHEFDITKDPALGYVPKSRLVLATDQLLKQRRARENSTSQIQGFSWIERGPYTDAVGPSNGNTRAGTPTPVTSGRIRAIWVDLADVSNKTVWIGGADGGIWKTTDITASPSNWIPVNDFMGNLAISSICQDPTNNNIMYCGTGEKTFNVDAVKGGGVWKSTDHGVNWTLLSSTVNFWNVSKVLCDNAGNLYAGTIGSGDGLQRSTDGGVTWTKITPTINAGGGGVINTTRVADMAYDPSSDKLHVVMGYAPAASPAIYQGYCYTTSPSTVTQTTWTAASTTFITSPNSLDNCAIACSGNTVYALPVNSSGIVPSIYKSTNGGVTWTATGTTPSNSGTNAFSNGQGWYCLALGIDPSNSNNVIVGSLNCYKTTNGGTTWSQISVWVGTTNDYVHADQHYVAWNGSQVLVASDGGLFYSPNNGTAFTDRNVNLRLKQFYSCAIHPVTPNYLLGGAQDNGVHQLNGAGLSSSVEVTGGDGGFVAIDQDEPLYQFGSYVYNVYRRSTDGGSTWSTISFNNGTSGNASDLGDFINPYDYDDANNIIYAAANAGEFLRWTTPQTTPAGSYYAGANGGPTTLAKANAALVSINSLGNGSVSALKVSPYTPNTLFLGTSEGKIVRVNNANTISSGSAGTDLTGASFTAGGNISCINIGSSDGYLIASFSNYGINNIWVSTNGGTSWAAVDGNLPDIPIRWVMFYPGDNTKAIIATEMGVYQTQLLNGTSTTWNQESEFPIVRTDMLEFRSSDRTIVAATHGRGMWTAPLIPIVLPVSLINFEGHLFNSVVTLDWYTSVENNSKIFEVEKSSDGKNFYSIGSASAAGNSSSVKKYSLVDNKVSDLNYYRLKIIDRDGKYVYSNVILIKGNSVQQFVWVLNNPFRDHIDLRFARPAKSVKIQLTNMSGQIVSEKILSMVTGQKRVEINNNLNKGILILKIISDGTAFTNKLVRE